MNRFSAFVVCLALNVAPLTTRAGEAEDNLARVKEMSRVDRARMSRALETFDTLDPSEREKVRELNARLAELDPKARARYLEMMRRYHVFYQGLTKDKRAALDREPDSARKLALIASYRADQKNDPRPEKTLADALQVSTLTSPRDGQNPLRLRGSARHLIVYFGLDPVEDAPLRKELAQSKTPADREVIISKLIKGRPRNELRALREKLREEEEEFLAAGESVFIKNPVLAKRLLQGQFDAAKADYLERKGNPVRAKAVLAKADDEARKRRNPIIMVLDELQVLRELDEEMVSPANLDRFEAALPPWAKDSLDALPPEAARRRLKALYRLVYPSPEEMPATKGTMPPKPARPVPPGPSGTNSF